MFEILWIKLAGFNATPAVIFLTGLSGSGKTTTAKELLKKFQQKGNVPAMLDGDEIRNVIKQTGFDERSRKNHNLNVGFMASLLQAQGNFVIVALISPYEDTRNTIRGLCKNFKEVYISTDIKVCMKKIPRDFMPRL
ncbi:MAG: adenylyl-sulfate kinase [Ferruginibacter sp.]